MARKEAAMRDMKIEGFTEKDHGMVRLEKVRDVLFQGLLLDNVKIRDGMIYTEFYTIFAE